MTDVTVKVIKRDPVTVGAPVATSVIKIMVPGPQGPAGKLLVGEGAHIYEGSGVPDNALGGDGEWFIDATTANMYQKQAGVWVLILNLKGPQGIQGAAGQDGQILVGSSNISTGAGAPDNANGNDGDIYLNTINDDVYQKELGIWVLKTNIKGSPGIQGIQGIQGNPGTNGVNGWSPVLSLITDGARRVLEVTDWEGGSGTKPAVNLYISATGLTSVLANAIDVRGAAGIQGIQGIQGNDGTNGNVIENINKQTDDYTLALVDKSSVVEMEKATPLTLTVPPHSDVAFAVKAEIEIVQTGIGQLTIAAGLGVTVHSAADAFAIIAQWGGASLYQRAIDEWVLVGYLE